MVSVCMATRNGEKYIAQQLNSILPQLASDDEIVITDDASTDRTAEIIRAYGDPRIVLHVNSVSRGISGTFEKSLRHCRGSYVFLADQDDQWIHGKVKVMTRHLERNDLVVSDCMLVDHLMKANGESFYTINRSGRGFLKNLIRNSYMGCCMAFRRSVLDKALPFPPDIPMHDYWIGLICELHFRVTFIPDVLIYHRRHFSNASTNGVRSTLAFSKRLMDRYRLIKNLMFRKSYAA